jgi:hypothetical protein
LEENVINEDKMMIIIFWEMTPCGSYIPRVAAYTRAYCFALYLLVLVHPEDGGDTIL